MQTVRLPARAGLARVHAALAREGVQAVPQLTGKGGVLSFLLRADHREQEVAHALAALERQLELFKEMT